MWPTPQIVSVGIAVHSWQLKYCHWPHEILCPQMVIIGQNYIGVLGVKQVNENSSVPSSTKNHAIPGLNRGWGKYCKSMQTRQHLHQQEVHVIFYLSVKFPLRKGSRRKSCQLKDWSYICCIPINHLISGSKNCSIPKKWTDVYL